MAVMRETQLQQRIQKLIRSRGGYVHKNHGSMISEPGIADLTVCYKGYYVALEVKEDNNTPTKQQGIHARLVWKAGGIACVVWSVEEVNKLLDILDNNLLWPIWSDELNKASLDDGTRW